MAKTTDEIRILIKAEVNDALKKMKKLNDTNKTSTSVIDKLRVGYLLLAGVIGGVVVGGIVKATKKAIDFEETVGKFNVVFAGVENAANDMVRTLNQGFGFSATAARELLATTGDLLAGFGFTGDKSLELSGKLAKLGSGLASFSNLEGGAEEATRRLTSALTGETEGIKALGIIVSQTSRVFRDRVKQLQETEGLTLAQAKAMAILEEATKQSANAIGDFARTQDSTANLLKRANNAIEDLTVIVGQQFLAVFKPAIKAFATFVESGEGLKVVSRTFNILLFVLQSIKANLTVLKNAFEIGLINPATQFIKTMRELSNIFSGSDGFLGAIKRVKEIGITNFNELKENNISDLEDIKKAGIDLYDNFNTLLDDNVLSLKTNAKVSKDTTKEIIQLTQEEIDALDRLKEAQKESAFITKEVEKERRDIVLSSGDERIRLIRELAEKLKIEEEAITAIIFDEEEARAINSEIKQQERNETIRAGIQTANEHLQFGAEQTQNALDGTSEIFDLFSNKRRIQLANDVKDLEKARDSGAITEEEFVDRLKALRKKEAEQKHKDAKKKKVFDIIQSEINTLTAVGNTVASLPFPANVIAGALVEIQGHIRTALIASTPIPKFPHGGSFITNGPGQFIAGDTPNGRERVTVAQQPGITNNDNRSSSSGDVTFNIMANDPIQLNNELEKQGYSLVRNEDS